MRVACTPMIRHRCIGEQKRSRGRSCLVFHSRQYCVLWSSQKLQIMSTKQNQISIIYY